MRCKLDKRGLNVKDSTNIALFVDMENLVISALEIGLPVDLSRIIARLLEYGRLSIRRGFGDLDMACRKDWGLRGDLRRQMQENLIQFEDIPYITRYKNTADMRLTVEALSTAYNYPDIDSMAIVAADRDYVPLIAKVRELGKTIIGVGPSPDTVNEIYINSCDIFLYYSSMFDSVPGPMVQIPGQHDSGIVEDYLMLLKQAVAALILKGAKPVGAAIVPLIRQLRPDFDLRLANLNSFRQLVSIAEQNRIVEVQPHGGDILVNLIEPSGAGNGTAVLRQQPAWTDLAKARTMYRQFFEDKLRCQLPSLATRNMIYDKAATILGEMADSSLNTDLNSLSEEINKRVGESVDKAASFKVIYALFRANAFEYELGIQPYNPKIRAISKPKELWELLFIHNCLVVLQKERRNWPVLEGPLADVFETSEDTIKAAISETDEFAKLP